MNTFYLKQGDTKIPLSVVLSDANGPVDLTDCTVRLFMRPWDGLSEGCGAIKVNAEATPDANQVTNMGLVIYEWEAADVDTPGKFANEWQVTFADGEVATFPRTEDQPPFDVVVIWPSLAPAE